MPNPRGKLQLILDVLASNQEPYNPNDWRREPWPARKYETISEYQVWLICFQRVCYVSRISGEAEPVSSPRLRRTLERPLTRQHCWTSLSSQAPALALAARCHRAAGQAATSNMPQQQQEGWVPKLLTLKGRVQIGPHQLFSRT